MERPIVSGGEEFFAGTADFGYGESFRKQHLAGQTTAGFGCGVGVAGDFRLVLEVKQPLFFVFRSG